MKSVSLVQFSIIVFFKLTSFAGGWTSGGSAELLKDSRNPWFLNNISYINYCVLIDVNNFGVSKAQAQNTIIKAFDFWKTEFSKAMPVAKSVYGPIKFATQELRRVECDSHVKVDIQFQFGVLFEKQIKFLGNPKKLAAISVRTDYSLKELHGRGFIYVSPERGPLAYNLKGVLENSWSKNENYLLFLTLVHELGHVFGIPHVGSLGELMSEGFVESMLWESKLDRFNDLGQDFRFFSFTEKSKIICPQEPLITIWRQFFNLTSEDKCIQFVFKHSEKNQLFGETQLFILAGQSSTHLMRQMYTLELKMNRFNPVYMSTIWLNDEQILIEKGEMLKISYPGVLGLSLLGVSKSGFFNINSTQKQVINVHFEQGRMSFKIDGINSNGDLIPIL